MSTGGETEMAEKQNQSGQHQQPSHHQQQPSAMLPPVYSTYESPSVQVMGAVGGEPARYADWNRTFLNPTPQFQDQRPLIQGHPPPNTIMVTNPVIVAEQRGPDTLCALILNTLAVFFCFSGLFCGIGGILFAWKARMHVLSKKLDHARHTLNISWLFLFMAGLFGLACWIPFIIWMVIITHA